MSNYTRTLPKPFIVYDLEFTDPKVCKELGIKPEIIEVGAYKLDIHGEIEDSFSSLVKPSDMRAVTPFILQLTGINHQQLQSADSWDVVWPFFNSFCEGRHLISWTWKDQEILSDCVKTQRKWKEPMFCAMSLSAGFALEWGLDFQSYSLKSVRDYFGIKSEGHRALKDAKVVVDIFKCFLEFEL